MRPTSRYRYVELSDLFSAGKVLDCHLARVCVLYEDLRLESTALYDDEFLVRSGVKPFKFNAQKTYFLRRVIGTIREYVEVVRLIDQCEEFQLLKSKFSPETSVKWQEALDRCRETEKFLKLVRNDVSGHLGYAAAKYGVKSVAERRGIGGMIEYRDPRIDPLGVGTNKSSPHLKGKLPRFPLRLHFVANLPLAAMLRHSKGQDPGERLSYLDQEVAKALDAVNRATVILVAECLAPRLKS